MELERYDPRLKGRIGYEHFHRYMFIERFCAGKTVLDIACGEGYGAAILARTAAKVHGVDLDPDCVAAASVQYESLTNLQFTQGTCVDIPFAAASFDVVVSLETIEHIKEQEQFLAEIARVLRPDGQLVISTPNRPVYAADERPRNVFHVRELDRAEFETLLGRYFESWSLLGQRFVIPSVLMPLSWPIDGEKSVALLGPAPHGVLNLLHPEYFLAFCTRTGRLPVLSPSFYLDMSDDLWLEYERTLRWASGLHEEDEILRQRLQASERNLKLILESRGQIPELQETASDEDRLINQIRDLKISGQELAAASAERLDHLRDLVAATLQHSQEHIHRHGALMGSVGSLMRLFDDVQLLHKAVLGIHNATKGRASELAEQLRVRDELLASRLDNLREAQAAAAAMGQLAHLRAEVLASDLRSRDETISQLQEAALAQRTRLAAQEASIRSLEEGIDEMGRRNKELERQRDANIAAVNALKSEIENLRKQLVAVLADVESLVEVNQSKDQLIQQIAQTSPAISYRHGILRQLQQATSKGRRLVPSIPYDLYFDRSQLRSRRAPQRTPNLSWARRRALAKLSLFDARWYLDQNPDVAASGVEPRKHFLQHGALERRDPHPLFSSYWSLISNREFPTDVPPVLTYQERPSDYEIHPLFDAAFYRSTNQDLDAGTMALDHFLLIGARQMRDPHPLVQMKRLAQQPGLATSDNLLLDYLTKPEYFSASPHPLFDPDYYLSENSDVIEMGLNPLLHYCAIGWREGRQPNRIFSGDWYLMSNPDVLASGQNPLKHYAASGWSERRAPHPMFDPKFYLSRYHDVRDSGGDPLTHYLEQGAWEGRETTSAITVEQMREITPGHAWRNHDPITAFLGFGMSEPSAPSRFEISSTSALVATKASSFWPPKSEPIYWLPQELRDYILSRFGEEKVDLYSYLMSVLDKFEDNQGNFGSSTEFESLVRRLKYLNARACLKQGCRASIIVPVYNNLLFTLTCVVSILEDDVPYGFEILIGDDGSSDGTDLVFREIGGCVKLVHHLVNKGFLGNCNATAEAASGEVLVLLNNDTLILPGWLDGLVRLLERHPNYGLVGSKLINSDGTLQEAGGIFWSDGSAWNFGRNQSPSLPEFNYLKPVDYISGASIALRRADWIRLEGFDPHFSPAYCEDSDLAFRVRALGMETIYTPQSEVIHHEGKSHGRDTGTGIKAYQVANQAKLVERWGALLKERHFPNGQDVFLARDRSRNRMHILIVDHYIPQWDRDAGSRTMLHFMRMFVNAGIRITFWPDNLFEDKPYCRVLQELGVEVIYSSAYQGRFQAFIRDNGKYFDYVLLSRPHIAVHYYSDIRAYSKAQILYYGHDVHFARMEMELAMRRLADAQGAVEQMRQLEMDNWHRADAVLYPSVDECELVTSMAPSVKVYPVPMLGFTKAEMEQSWRKLKGIDERDSLKLLFVGGSHPPNVDALNWFMRSILPTVLKKSPGTRLRVVGAADIGAIPANVTGQVEFLGRLTDEELEREYTECGAAIVPLRFGAGVKGKTIEAMLNAIPLITTSVGLQGISAGEPLVFLANTAEGFAAEVLRVQGDPAERRLRAERALHFLTMNYTEKSMIDAFSEFMPSLSERIKSIFGPS